MEQSAKRLLAELWKQLHTEIPKRDSDSEQCCQIDSLECFSVMEQVVPNIITEDNLQRRNGRNKGSCYQLFAFCVYTEYTVMDQNENQKCAQKSKYNEAKQKKNA